MCSPINRRLKINGMHKKNLISSFELNELGNHDQLYLEALKYVKINFTSLKLILFSFFVVAARLTKNK